MMIHWLFNVMYNHFLILLLLITFTKCFFSQNNLVLNGCFNDTIACPNTSQLELSKYWINPNTLSPDFFHECNSSSFGIPTNALGFQYPHCLNAYAGFYVFNKISSTDREYVQTKLVNTLIKNNKYCVSFCVSLADKAGYAIAKIGAYFSENPIFTVNAFVLTPQIVNATGVLSNKENWIKIEGSFIANGNENYITIGNFYTDGLSDTLYVGTVGQIALYSYYYIDDISVVLCEDTLNPTDTFYLHIPNIFTPNADGQNDAWQVKARGVQQLSAAVYNRWGALLWQQSITDTTAQTEIKTAWNGYTSTGIPVSAGTYYYLVSYTSKEGETKKEKGFLTLVR